MIDYKTKFIQLAKQKEALRFGEFLLKSGRVSPYFFNAGFFHYGSDLEQLGKFYAHAILASDIAFDVLYGPAYKGIPLVCSAAMGLAKLNINKPYTFNRKEVKDHGEGGLLVGADIKGASVLIVDDVITAGTAIAESIQIIKASGGNPCGVVIALDRQEQGNEKLSAIQQIEKDYGIPVFSIINLTDIIKYLSDSNEDKALLEQVNLYRDVYGIG